MNSLFGLSMDSIMGTLLAVCAGVGALLAFLALRHRALVRLALWNVPRRRGQTALIVVGLMLNTAIITSSFATGDTMTFTARSVVAGTLGRADEVIVSLAPFRRGRLGPEGLAGLSTGYFAQSDYDRLRPSILAISGVAGLTPVLVEQVSLVDRTSRQSKASVTLLGLLPDYDRAFGALSSLDGRPASLVQLGADEVYLNRQGADALGAAPGDQLDLFFGSARAPSRLKAVVRNGGPGGSQPVAMIPLARLQQLRGHDGEINQIYVANQGDELTGDRWSGQVVAQLRPLLIDRAATSELRDLVRTAAVKSALVDALPSMTDGDRAVMQRFLAETEISSADGGPTPRFNALVTDRTVALRLGLVAFRLQDQNTGTRMIQLLRQVATLRVNDVKHQGLLAADTLGAATAGLFVGLGLFSIASGLLLIYLIFVMLAAERRAEMGVLRAIGLQRRHLVELFLYEGAVYDLAAALAGTLVGLGVGLATTRFLAAVLQAVDIRVAFYVEPHSVIIAFCLGLAVTFLTVGGSALKVSRLNVVLAMHNLPETTLVRRPLHVQRSGASSSGFRSLPNRAVGALHAAVGAVRGSALVAVLGLAAVTMSRDNPPLLAVRALGTSALIVGAALFARRVLAACRVFPPIRDRLCYTAAGVGLLAYWAAPFNLLATMRPRDLQAGVELYFLAGIAMVAGATWAVVYNAEAVLLPLAALAGRLLPIAAVLRTSAAYALRQRFRTGMTLAMFALVVFTMVVASVLSTASQKAYGDVGLQEGGFDIRGDTRFDRPIPDIASALASASGVRRDDVSASGAFASVQGNAIETTSVHGYWRPIQINAADAGFLDATTFRLTVRADGYRDDRAVWRALRSTPGLAVVGSDALAADAQQAPSQSSFALSGVLTGQSTMRKATVWVRADAGSQPVKLTVIGVLDPRAAYGSGVTASRTTFGSSMDFPWGHTYYFRVRSGLDVRAVARGLGLSFVDEGMQTQVLADEQTQIEGVRLLLNQLLQSYLGLGLIVGVASLGVISTRAVVERRQQIGVLRAIGFQRRMVQASFLIEAAGVAIGGVVLGIALGLQLARSLTGYIGRSHPEIIFSIPWVQLGALAGVTCAFALLAAWLPARHAAAVRPAEALRYE